MKPGATQTRARTGATGLLMLLVMISVQDAAARDKNRPLPPDHDITLPAGDTALPGEEHAVSLTIAARPGFAISNTGPLLVEVSVTPAEGVDLAKHRYRRDDAADARAGAPRFDLRYRAKTPGRYELQVNLAFWVCGRHACRPVHAARAVSVTVTPSPGE